MKKEERDKTEGGCTIDVSDKDIYDAMKDIPGYLDITPGDLKEIYRHAYQHAIKRLAGSVKAKDVMTRKVISVAPGTPLSEVARTMAEHGVSGIPVVEDKKVAGMITEKDFLSHMGTQGIKTVMALLAEFLDRKECPVEPLQSKAARDIMSVPVITVDEEDPVAKIADLFAARRINRAPVLDKEGIMIGIISRDDLVKAFSGGSCGVL
jgi:CBS domain-containing membrane protein